MAGENINRRLNIYINDREVVNSMRGVGSEMTRVRNEMRNLNAGAADYNERLAGLRSTYSRLTQEQARFRSEIAETPGILQKIKGALGPVASGMIAAFSIGSLVAGAMAALGNAKKLIFDFEQSVADLSAITGASGKDLDFLKNAAIDLGEKTKGGAVAVVEAYKLIASAKPELLENVEALNQVTEATLLLAKASGMEMPAAATALTDAMNQFGADASQAAFFVDALANGAKYGAAEIPQVTEALLKFGAVARNSNVNIQESTALIEALAEKGLKGAEAGTALRNVMLKLSAPDALPKEAQDMMKSLGISFESLKDTSKPFSERLDSLKPLLKDNAALIKVFGTENAVAAVNLLTSTERIKDLTAKMGESGSAFEQAAIKMDTVNNKTELLKSKYDSLILSISKGGGAVSSFFKFFIDGASGALSGLIKLNSSVEELGAKERTKGSNYIAKVFNVDKNVAELEKERTVITAEMKKTTDQINTLTKDLNERSALQAFNPFAKGAGVAKKELTELYNTLGQYEGAYKKIQSKLNPTKTKPPVVPQIVPPDTPSGLNTSGSGSGTNSLEKKLADAKKHSEDLLKQENDLQKSLIDSRSKADELKFGLIKDNYARESALVNAEYDKKIEDLELNLKKEQEAIDKLRAAIASPKTSGEDLVSFKKQLADRLDIQKNYNETIISTNQTRDLKLGALQEKYLQKNIADHEKENARDLLNLRTRQNNELAGIQSLEDAKAVLSQTLSVDELAKIKTLEDAKTAIKEQHLKEEYDLQLKYLNELSTEYKNLLDGQTVDGLKILTAEQRDEILANLDIVKNKISEIGVQKAEDPEAKKEASGIDLLGFSPEDWESSFSNIDTLEEKLNALGMVVLGLKNAFGIYFQFVEAGEKKKLQKFEANNQKQQASLANQLEKGIITQEVYNARKAKLDSDLARKKAEIEYKQAKREKMMNIAGIIGNTALGVAKALGQGGMLLGVPFAGIVGALGAIQLGLALAQPLPEKGFYDGGYTGSGNERNSPGPVHYDEYVIPKKVLFSNDPLVPNIVGYLESKRTGKTPMNSQEETGSSSASSQGGSTVEQAATILLTRAVVVLEKLEEQGVEAYLVNDIKTAKKMRDKIKEVTKLETNAKL